MPSYFVERCGNGIYGSRIWISSDSGRNIIKTLSKMSFWGSYDKSIYREPPPKYREDYYISFEMDDDTINSAILICQENKFWVVSAIDIRKTYIWGP